MRSTALLLGRCAAYVDSDALRNADPRPEEPDTHWTANQAPRKCTETMLLSPICQWPNELPRTPRNRDRARLIHARAAPRSGSHSIYEIKRQMYERAGRRLRGAAGLETSSPTPT